MNKFVVLFVVLLVAYSAYACGKTECSGEPLNCGEKPIGWKTPTARCFGTCSLFCTCTRNRGALFTFRAYDNAGKCIKFGDAYKQLSASLKAEAFNLAKQSCERLQCVCPSSVTNIPAGDAVQYSQK